MRAMPLLLLMVSCTSCAALEAEVKIYDMSCWDRPEVIKPMVAQLATQVKSREHYYSNLQNDVKGVGGAEENVKQGHARHLEGVDLFGAAVGEKDKAKQGVMLQNALASFALGNTELRQVAEKAPGKQLEAKVDALLTVPTNLEMLDEPTAWVVVYSPNDCWEKTYGRASGTGWFGNTDIAIKMDAPGSFVVKGLRLDAAKMTEALFKGINQGIQMVAEVYGGAIAPALSQSDTTNTAATVTDIAKAKASKLMAERQINETQVMLRHLLEAIIIQKETIESGKADTWQAGFKIIQQNIAAFKPLILQ